MPAVIETCEGCGAVIPCTPDSIFGEYSLSGDPTFPFTFFCPPGFNCRLGGSVSLDCCKHIITRTIPPDATQAQLSAIYQDMLNQCRLYQSECSDPPTDPPGGGGPIDPVPIYFSNPTSCISTCDGNIPFEFFLPAGAFSGPNQQAVDKAANDQACYLARLKKICLSALPGKICLETPLNLKIIPAGNFVGGGIGQYDWTITAGALPAGLTFNGGFLNPGVPATITGTATAVETATFTVRVTAPDLVTFMERNYTVCTVGISPSTLPVMKLGIPYSQQLTALGCVTPPLSWQVVGGGFPPGITLNEATGLISGTPSGALLGYRAIIKLQDQAT